MANPKLSKLPKTEARTLSGPDKDVSRSLDADRTWLSTECAKCGAQAVIQEPPPELRQVGYIADEVIATLPDGREIAVAGVPMTAEAETVTFTCNNCGKTQEAAF